MHRPPGHVDPLTAATTPEPPPEASTGDVWQEIIDTLPEGELREVCLARRQMGIDKYGTPLQRDNGRDHATDEAQEHLDAAAYRAARCGADDLGVRSSLLRAAQCLGLPDVLLGADPLTMALRDAVEAERVLGEALRQVDDLKSILSQHERAQEWLRALVLSLREEHALNGLPFPQMNLGEWEDIAEAIGWMGTFIGETKWNALEMGDILRDIEQGLTVTLSQRDEGSVSIQYSSPADSSLDEVLDRTDHEAIRNHVNEGHTEHCAKRLVWGDGECECSQDGSVGYHTLTPPPGGWKLEEADHLASRLRLLVMAAQDYLNTPALTQDPSRLVKALGRAEEALEQRSAAVNSRGRTPTQPLQPYPVRVVKHVGDAVLLLTHIGGQCLPTVASRIEAVKPLNEVVGSEYRGIVYAKTLSRERSTSHWVKESAEDIRETLAILDAEQEGEE